MSVGVFLFPVPFLRFQLLFLLLQLQLLTRVRRHLALVQAVAALASASSRLPVVAAVRMLAPLVRLPLRFAAVARLKTRRRGVMQAQIQKLFYYSVV